IKIIPNVRYARRGDSLHHRTGRSTLLEMRGEPKPVVTSVRRYVPDCKTQYRQKPHNNIKRRLSNGQSRLVHSRLAVRLQQLRCAFS
ncbi:MAG: hypothetical protein WB586_06060, partial [Chthoniobacterales bacterium]